MHIVIIGNGVAGIEAALQIREREPTWPITIISEESDHFFSRTALMWVVCGQMNQRDIEPYERDLYRRMNFTRVRARALRLDTHEKVVHLSHGKEAIHYDRLLIACGSKPRPAPWTGADLRGIGHFVTLQDMEWLSSELHGTLPPQRAPRPEIHFDNDHTASPYQPREAASKQSGCRPQQPAVIGGGLIGIEAIEVMLAAGLKPKFFIRDEWFWPIALDKRESEWIAKRMSGHGVDVHLEHEVKQLVGNASHNVATLVTNEGTYPTDLVVVAIGVVPNTAWLEGSGIECDKAGGIPADIDSGLVTNVKDVYAAGDCATVRWFNGQHRPEQLWYTARDQGRVAAAAIVGDTVRYDRGIWYNSAKLMDIEYTTVGQVNMRVDGEKNWFFQEDGKVNSTLRIVHKDDAVIGFNMLGRRWDHTVMQRWIAERRSLSFVLGRIHEAEFDTEFVPPLNLDDAPATNQEAS